MKHFTRNLLIAIVAITTTMCTSPSGIDTVRERLLEHNYVAADKIDDAKVEKIISTFNAKDSIWEYINYIDTSRTGFEHKDHLDNVIDIAQAYQADGSKWYKNSDAKAVIDVALAFWFDHNFIGANWWNNEIGTPTQMTTILYTLNDELTPEQSENIIKIASRAHMNAWGARQSGDRIKIAGLEAKRHIYTRNSEKFKELLKIIEGEMAVRNKERGLQADNSFHHREDGVNNTLTYGQNYVNVFSEWVELINGTEFKFSEEKLKVAIDYYLDGICKQMIYGMYTSPGVKNRDIARASKLSPMNTTAPEALMSATTYRRDELDNIIKARKGEEFKKESFAKFYWESEHFVLQRPNYYTSVRMYSKRNSSMEYPYNGEGLRNHYRGDGANYLSHLGDEQTAITAYNDWQKIPGATILQTDKMPGISKVREEGITSFVGGVEDGVYGAAGFDFKSPISGMSAKKSWFFFDDEYVCLGAAINSNKNSKNDVVTTLDQVRTDGDVTLKTNGKISKQELGNCSNNKQVEWVHHNNIGYYFPQNQNVYISNKEQVGSWRLINIQSTTPKDEVKGDVFKLWIDHGTNCVDKSYSYIVFPYITLGDMEKKSVEDINIIRNDKDIQAVKHNKLGILYIVFYNAGSVEIDKNNSITVDQPSILMVKYDEKNVANKIYVSDPNRDKQNVNIEVINGETNKTITVELPQGDFTGSTTHVDVK